MHLRKVSPQCIIIRGQFVGVNKPSRLSLPISLRRGLSTSVLFIWLVPESNNMH